MIKRWACEWAAAAGIGIGLDRWFNPDAPTPMLHAAAISVALLVAAQIALGVIAGLGGLLYLGIAKGADMEMIALTDLRSAAIPPPGPYQSKRWDYLLDLADDESADTRHRIRAAALTSTYAVIFHRAGFFGRIAWTEAADKAVVRYAEEAPAK